MEHKTQLVWTIWDAVSAEVTSELMQKGLMPYLSAMKKYGVGLSLLQSGLNTQTPCALAAQMCGKRAEFFGIGGFNTPNRNSGTPLDYMPSFGNVEAQHNVFWHKNNIGDRRITLAQIPYVNSQQNNITHFDGYSNIIEKGKFFSWNAISSSSGSAILEFSGCKLQILLDKENFILSREDGEILKCVTVDDFSNYSNHDVWLSNGIGFQFYVFHIDFDYILFFSDAIIHKITMNSENIEIYPKQYGVFFGRGYGNLFRAGVFGKPVYLGGDGKADDIFMFFCRRVAFYFQKLLISLIANSNTEIVIGYNPCLDDIQHEFWGWAFSKESAVSAYYKRRIYEFYQLMDSFVGELVASCCADNFVISSDHGMYEVSKTLYPNQALFNSGLLMLKSDGTIDTQRSIFYYHPCNSGAIFLGECGMNRFANLLPVLEHITANGKPLFENILVPQNHLVFGDIFAFPQEHSEFDANIFGNLCASRNKTGSHTFNFNVPSLNGILYAYGTRIRQKNKLCAIENFRTKGVVTSWIT
jgi:hypothetical protein